MCKLACSLINNLAHGNFVAHFSWNFLLASQFYFLIPTLNGMGRLFSRLGENPFNDIRTSSLGFVLEGS
jgi:hypothetical protein